MQRLTATLLVASTIGVASSFAGQVQIGGVNGIQAPASSTSPSVQPLTASSTTAVGERGYDPRLFLGVTPNPTPYSGYSATAASAGTFTDSANGVTFSAINDGVGGGNWSNNFWDIGIGSSTGASLTVPIDLYDVTSVYTMLNELNGLAGNTNAQVTFNFSGFSPLVINLTASSPTAAGQIRDSVDCSTACTNPTTAVTMASGGLAGTTFGNVSVVTGTVFSTGYTGDTGNNFAKGSTGNVYLDDQGFNFTGTQYSAADVELLSIQITNLGTGGDLALSAVTVDSAVPEPSTILLGLAGFGLLGATRLRRHSVR